MAHELSNFDLLAAQADELILHVTKLERENAALHIELAKQNRCVAIISSFVPHPIAWRFHFPSPAGELMICSAHAANYVAKNGRSRHSFPQKFPPERF